MLEAIVNQKFDFPFRDFFFLLLCPLRLHFSITWLKTEGDHVSSHVNRFCAIMYISHTLTYHKFNSKWVFSSIYLIMFSFGKPIFRVKQIYFLDFFEYILNAYPYCEQRILYVLLFRFTKTIKRNK